MESMNGVSAARGAALLAKQVERALGDADLTMPQYRLLGLLEKGDATATFAAERLAVSPPSVTAIVDGLVARSLVARGSVEGDKRRVELCITEEGTAALGRADEVIERRLREIAENGPSGEDLEAALHALGWWAEAVRTTLTSREPATS